MLQREMAAQLAELSAHLNLSQRQMADLVDMTPKHINRVFNGRATARPETLNEWAEALGYEFQVQLVKKITPH